MTAGLATIAADGRARRVARAWARAALLWSSHRPGEGQPPLHQVDEAGQRQPDQPLLYPWGDAMPPPKESGNFAHDGSNLPFAIPGYVDGYPASAPVGKFAPNKARVYDLGGNVAEWCHDFYDVPVAGAPLVDPTGPASGRFHVIKGASWRSGSVTELRLSFRDYAEKPRDDLGFRVVRYADAK